MQRLKKKKVKTQQKLEKSRIKAHLHTQWGIFRLLNLLNLIYSFAK